MLTPLFASVPATDRNATRRLEANYAIPVLPPGIFDELGQLERLRVSFLSLISLASGSFDNLANLTEL